ncbi:phosphopantetheine-binding protein [Crocinitomix catalasitica]|uniref:phosphopantetheine-binding protein n=1 Tax=Crocinitomix catalasitica TaxID=184607 RepID=UPI0004869FB9|nr:phosphopantetheine-binding protein [Crocinitomix catalasitica]
MDELIVKLKGQIIEYLNLEDINAEDIVNTDPLFGDGLALDSIDALELIVLLEQEYGIVVADPEKGKEIFESIQTLAEYISANK